MVSRQKNIKSLVDSVKTKSKNKEAYETMGQGLLDKEFTKNELFQFGPNIDKARTKAANYIKNGAKVNKAQEGVKIAKEYIQSQRKKFNEQSK